MDPRLLAHYEQELRYFRESTEEFAQEFPKIAARLGDLRKRGITLREGQTLQQLYDERVPLYERYADITVDCENKSIREIVAEIVARLPK